MAKRYTKRPIRSRRKGEKVGRGGIAGIGGGSVQLRLPIFEVLAGTREATEELAAQAGLLVMSALMEEEDE